MLADLSDLAAFLLRQAERLLPLPLPPPQLIFDNAMRYNPPSNPVFALAERVRRAAARHAQQLLPRMLAGTTPAVLQAAATMQETPSFITVGVQRKQVPIAPIRAYTEVRLERWLPGYVG